MSDPSPRGVRSRRSCDLATAPAAARLPSGLAIRTLVPSDREAVRTVFEQLSKESRYRRFLGPKPVLSERELRYLVDVDDRDHIGLVVETVASGRPVAVGRMVRLTAGGSEAELAVAVSDDWQGRGIGTRIVRELIERARSLEIGRIHVETLASNDAMMRVLRRHGFRPAAHRAGTVTLELEVEPRPRRTLRDDRLLRRGRRAAGTA
jgi:RimJ/RimL family protein N-acetyltransferase